MSHNEKYIAIIARPSLVVLNNDNVSSEMEFRMEISNIKFFSHDCNFAIANAVSFPIKYLSLLNFLCYIYMYTFPLRSWLDQKILLNAFVDAENWRGEFLQTRRWKGKEREREEERLSEG